MGLSAGERSEQNEAIPNVFIEARDYAQTILKESHTRLSANQLEKKQHDDVCARITLMRNYIISKLKQNNVTEDDSLLTLYHFMAMIKFLKQYRIGDCQEYAVLVLYYLMEHEPTLALEIFHIKGGDHGIVVAGRKRGSDPSDPSTWGEDAYIIDAWSENNDVNIYSVKEYRSYLKNNYFTYENGRVVSRVEAFDPVRHTLAINESHYTADDIFSQIYNLLTLCVDILKTYIKAIKDIKSRLEDQYGKDDFKFKIISAHYQKISTSSLNIKSMLENNKERKKNTCSVLCEELEALDMALLTQAEVNVLNTHRWFDSIQKFFNRPVVSGAAVIVARKRMLDSKLKPALGLFKKYDLPEFDPVDIEVPLEVRDSHKDLPFTRTKQILYSVSSL